MVQQSQRLYKSRDDRLLFGVAGGHAEYFNIDPVLVRLGWVLLTVATGGIGLLVYVVLAIVTPDGRRQVSKSAPVDDEAGDLSESVDETAPDRRSSGRHVARNMLGIALIVVGGLVLFNELGVFGSIRWDIVWPAAIVILGVTILIPSFRR